MNGIDPLMEGQFSPDHLSEQGDLGERRQKMMQNTHVKMQLKNNRLSNESINTDYNNVIDNSGTYDSSNSNLI